MFFGAFTKVPRVWLVFLERKQVIEIELVLGPNSVPEGSLSIRREL
jgi:hypothetical protein